MRLVAAALLMLPAACGAQGEAPAPKPAEHAQARRARSDARMRAEGVPINAHLPVIEAEGEVALPTTEATAMRAVATLAVAAKGLGADRAGLDDLVRRYELKRWFSPEEATFMAKPNPTAAELSAHSWRFEAANVLFWSLGYVDRLGAPKTQCDPAVLMRLVRERSPAELIAAARSRPLGTVLDEADLIYRYRWALVDARVNGRAAPAGLSDDVAMERHQALNWLVQHATTAWDGITLDT